MKPLWWIWILSGKTKRVHAGDIHFINITVGIGQIHGFAPIGLKGNGRHSCRHIIITALGKHTATDIIQILFVTITVGKIVTAIQVLIKLIIIPFINSAIQSNIRNLPTRHHHIGIVVAIFFGMCRGIGVAEPLIVIRQLHLGVAIIVVQRVHVKDG